MRIISGKYKGKVFNTKLPTGIRPTQDAMRETIFNILNNYIDFENKNVADVCAGAGMLGLEALSRGVNFVYFVDKNKKAIDYIQNNLNNIYLKNINADKEYYKMVNLDAVQFINHFAANEFLFHNTKSEIAQTNFLDLIFLDPPYNTNIVNDILHYISEHKILHSEGIIIAETALHHQILLTDKLKILTERQFGASKISFICLSHNSIIHLSDF